MDSKQIREKYADPDNPRPGDKDRPPLPKDLRNARTPVQEQDNRGQPKDPLSPTEVPEGQGHGRIPHHTENPADDPVKVEPVGEATAPFKPSMETKQEATQGNPVAQKQVEAAAAADGKTEPGETPGEIDPDAVKPGDGLPADQPNKPTEGEGTGTTKPTEGDDEEKHEPTKAELYDRATELGIDGRSSMDKAALSEAIEKASQGEETK